MSVSDVSNTSASRADVILFRHKDTSIERPRGRRRNNCGDVTSSESDVEVDGDGGDGDGDGGRGKDRSVQGRLGVSASDRQIQRGGSAMREMADTRHRARRAREDRAGQDRTGQDGMATTGKKDARWMLEVVMMIEGRPCRSQQATGPSSARLQLLLTPARINCGALPTTSP